MRSIERALLPVPDLAPAALADVEKRTQEVGRYIFDHLKIETPWILQRRWWDDRLLSWTMHNEALKVQLFRFIDVLPMLKADDEVIGHLSQYLGEAANEVPWIMSTAVGLGRRVGFVASAIAHAARLSAQDYARRFIAGTNVGEVLDAARRERDLKRGFTLDLLGEAVISDLEADRYFQACAELFEKVSPEVNSWAEVPQVDRDDRGPIPRANVSVKLSALDCGFDAIDPEGTWQRAGGRLRELLRIARSQRAFLNVDMESFEKRTLTLEIFRRLLDEPEFRDYTDVGIVIQCYLRDSGADLMELCDWARKRGAPVWVRLVKGAYWDYETVHARNEGWPIPVFQQKWQSDAQFERLTRFLLSNTDALRPALGTHNIRSLAHGIAMSEHLGLPRESLEAQMLYGMGDPVKHAVVERGYRMRIYMPYGELIPGMAYLVRRLLENTSNDSFLRASFEEQIAPEILLRSPEEAGKSGGTASSPASEGGKTLSTTAAAGKPPVAPPKTDDEEDDEMSGLRKALAEFRNHPQVDFAEYDNRRAMQEALRQVADRLGRHYTLVIDNRPVDTAEQGRSLDPSKKDRTVGTVSMAGETQAKLAVEAAKRAFPAWAATPVAERAAFLRRAAAEMRERLFDLSAWEVYESGKPWREATADVAEAIDFCEYYALAAEQLFAPGGVFLPGEENQFEYLPRGITAVIAPWNFPLAILCGMTAAALVTGNPVIMKPAEQSPVIAAHLMRIFQDLGLPPGVLQFLPGRGEAVGAALVEHPDVAVVAFTGSRSVGLAIHAKAAQVSAQGAPQVKRVIAEMGGKNAIIVDSDADLDEAVLGVVRSAFGFQGQKCSACSRAIVLDGVHDTFVERLIEATRALQVGPAEDPATNVGPVIDAESQERVKKYCELGRSEGKEALATDIGPLAHRGYFVGPHIFSNIGPKAKLAQEEIFGPVLAVIRVKDFDEALQVANGTDYALTGGVFSRSPAHLDRARREMQVGNLYLNRGITGALVGRQPFGGFRMSGIGSKAGGPDYLLQFVQPRTITENTLRRGFAPPPEGE